MSRTDIETNGEKLILISEEVNINQYFSVRSRSPRFFMLAEPFTWAWVAIKLAEAAITYIGGKILASLLDANDNSNFEQLINNAVIELKRFIKQTLIQQVVDDCQDRVNTIKRDLLAYENAPNSSDHRLKNADLESSRLMSTLKSAGRVGIGPYTQSVSLRLLTLKIRAIKESKDEFTNLISAVDEAVDHVSKEISKIIEEFDFKFNHVGPVILYFHPTEYSDSGVDYGDSYACFKDPDGKEICSSDHENYFSHNAIDEATKLRDSFFVSLSIEHADIIKNVVLPLKEIMRIWNQAKDSAIEELSK